MREGVGIEAPLGYLRGEQDRVRQLLVEWCGICTGSYHLSGLDRMLQALIREFSQLPGEIEVRQLDPAPDPAGAVYPLGKVLRLQYAPEAPKQVLLCGHYDTVYGPDHPFQKCRWIDSGTLNAPGGADMKGGILVMLLALKAFGLISENGSLGWEVLLTPDEEIGSLSSAPLLREAAQRHSLGLVFEPTLPDGRIIRNRMGSGTFRARATGRAAHTGRNHSNGRNAIAALSRFIIGFEELNSRFGAARFNTGKVAGGGPANIVPERAEAVFNIRLKRMDDWAPIAEGIEALVDSGNAEEGIQLEWTGAITRPPRVVRPSEMQLFSECRRCAETLGFSLDWEDTGGGSDGNILSDAGLPILDGMGVLGACLHSPDEWVNIDSVIERASLTCLFLMRLAANEIAPAHVRS